MDEVRIGIAGLGHRALWWIRQLIKMPGYRITAIYDWIEPLHDPALALVDDGANVKRCTDYQDLLTYDGIDAVALCVRQPEQGALAAQALEAGKHVSAEVPAAHSIEDCWRIVLAAERSGKVYQLAEQTRYWGFIQAWRKLVADGALGDVVYAEGQYISYLGATSFFQDLNTGKQYSVEQLSDHPEAKPTWFSQMPPIHYLPHELSPMLKVLDDRVVEVVGMSTQRPSRSHPQINQPDIQVALMKTQKDTILRLATGFTCHVPEDDHHWYHLHGTRGRVQWRRSPNERPMMWLSGRQMPHLAEVDWRFERSDAPTEASGSGHGDADYYVHTTFREAVLHGRPLELDLYAAMDTAAPAILAAESIARNSQLLPVPDFRPGARRPRGQPPQDD